MGELVFVGLGLGAGDVSIRAIDLLRGCERVFAEFYTSMMIDAPIADLEERIGCRIELLRRRDVEESDTVIDAARRSKIAFLTAGDPMAATTHVEMRLRAEREGVGTAIVHGISIFSACASALGLQPYKFGRTVTLPIPEKGHFPRSPYDHMLDNFQRGLHTLILLDIREEEGRYMTCAEGIEWLLEAERKYEGGLITEDRLLCGAARVGAPTQKLVAGYPSDIMTEEMGPPLHTLVLPGRLHFMEAEALVSFAEAPKSIIPISD